MTREMLESEAWHALTIGARRVIDRVVLEHLAHAGTANGELHVTYDNFIAFGLSSRRATAQAIRIAVALGFIDVTVPGIRSFGRARRPSRYGLTWLPLCNRTPASNRWKRIESAVAARQAIRLAMSVSPSTRPKCEWVSAEAA